MRPNISSANSSTSIDFLPSVNFDDLHSSLFSDIPNIDSFPAPGGTFKHFDFDTTPVPSTKLKVKNPPTFTNPNPNANGRLGLSGGSIRRKTSGGQNGFDASGNNEAGQPIPIKIRRKGNLNVDAKAPRKSVGPGVLTIGSDAQANPRRPSLAQLGLGSSADGGVPLANGTQAASLATFDNTRYQKAKSFQATPRKSNESSTTPNGFLSQTEIFGGSHTQSPARPRTQGSSTPSNKRMSMLPNSAHATGLAARTISPTDARRLKRLSMMPNAPPVPFTPPTPQPDTPSSAGMPSAPSPSLAPRKSVTPSSSRTTPDPNRKSYSSGFSISSSTSFNSNANHNPAARLSQNINASRLPAPKSRIDNMQAGDNEFVPPVPKIPQAYGSPKEEMGNPFQGLRKASVASTISNSTLQHEDFSVKASQLAFQGRSQKNHQEPATERKPSGGIVRKPAEPLNLPPSTLLPLEPSIANKINNLINYGGNNEGGTRTPPPSTRGMVSTPRTPMTTYKTMFSKPFVDGTNAEPISIRSNSSHHFTRNEGLPFRASSSSSTMVPNRPDTQLPPASRPAMSPFVSSSLPKSSGEFTYTRRDVSNPADIKSEARLSKLTGPRTQRGRKPAKDDASSNQTDSPVEKPTTPSFGSSLRRKLSLTRRKSVSKSHNTADSDAEIPAKSRQSEDMPPPRLPASATWNGPFTSPSPSQRSQRSRNVSNASTVERNRSNTVETAEPPKKPIKSATAAGSSVAKRTTRSFLEGASKQGGSTLREFLHDVKASEPVMDRDDMAAEEEMKRLASKRKETENAARELDALVKRATAKERVSPNAALRMVKLNIFERGEIVDYKDVYFCGTQNAKKHQGDLSDTATNFGYDDERGDYNIVTGDHLSYRYEIVDILGKGSFGQVVRCIDHKTGALVAIKIIRNKKRFHQQALVEVDILQKLREWVSLLSPFWQCR